MPQSFGRWDGHKGTLSDTVRGKYSAQRACYLADRLIFLVKELAGLFAGDDLDKGAFYDRDQLIRESPFQPFPP